MDLNVLTEIQGRNLSLHIHVLYVALTYLFIVFAF